MLRRILLVRPGAVRRVLVCLEPRRRRTDDGIEFLPAAAFIEDLPALLE